MSVSGFERCGRSWSRRGIAHGLAWCAIVLLGCGGSRSPGGGSAGTVIPNAGKAGSSPGTGSAGMSSSGSGGKSGAGTGGATAVGSGGAKSVGSGGSMSNGSAGMSGGSGGMASSGACNTPTMGVMGGCAGVYPSTTIAALRKAPMSGCYELSHVGLVARTDSPTEPRIYVQDVNGADYSAIFAKCSNGGTHACAAPVLAKIENLYDTMDAGAKISVRGYYQYSSADGFEGFYVEDVVDECGMVPRPAPITLAMTDLTRDARTPAKWFRRATIDIPASDPLVMYDFSPPELALSAPQCPDWLGFAMIPKSAGATAATDCMATANPAGRTADPREIIIGRQFFNQFLFNTDCNCPGGKKQLLKPASTAAGKAVGYLVIERDQGMTNAYQVFEAAADQAFPLTIN